MKLSEGGGGEGCSQEEKLETIKLFFCYGFSNFSLYFFLYTLHPKSDEDLYTVLSPTFPLYFPLLNSAV